MTSQDYTQPDDHTPLTYDVTSGFKSFTVKKYISYVVFMYSYMRQGKFNFLSSDSDFG